MFGIHWCSDFTSYHWKNAIIKIIMKIMNLYMLIIVFKWEKYINNNFKNKAHTKIYQLYIYLTSKILIYIKI